MQPECQERERGEPAQIGRRDQLRDDAKRAQSQCPDRNPRRELPAERTIVIWDVFASGVVRLKDPTRRARRAYDIYIELHGRRAWSCWLGAGIRQVDGGPWSTGAA